jgi:hypothetical protein
MEPNRTAVIGGVNRQRSGRLVGDDQPRRYRAEVVTGMTEHPSGEWVDHRAFVRKLAACREYQRDLQRCQQVFGEPVTRMKEPLPPVKRYRIDGEKPMVSPQGDYVRYGDWALFQKQALTLKRELDAILPRYREAVEKARVFWRPTHRYGRKSNPC